MAWRFETAGRASEVIMALTAIDPAGLESDRDRAMRTYALAVLGTLPVAFGVIVKVENDDQTHINVLIRRQPFGNYAT